MRAICKIYHQAEELHAQGIHVISMDEKTGIQALERIHPTHPAKLGQVVYAKALLMAQSD